MKIAALVPLLYAEDVKATIEFYTTHLQFTCNNYDEETGWASLSNGDVELMLSKPNAHINFIKPVFTGSFYFRIQNVDALWDRLKDTVQVCYPIEIFA